MKKTDIKAVATVTVGVILAGFVMNQLRGLQPVAQARAGFN